MVLAGTKTCAITYVEGHVERLARSTIYIHDNVGLTNKPGDFLETILLIPRRMPVFWPSSFDGPRCVFTETMWPYEPNRINYLARLAQQMPSMEITC